MLHELIVETLKTRLDKYLAEQLKDISRSQVQRDIEAGKVLVNGETILVTKFVVRLNDKVVYNNNYR
jgi:predicted rRNA methylase YqxC with S4 and FtsJ domains